MVSWLAYGFFISSYISSHFSLQSILAERVALKSIALYNFPFFLYLSALGAVAIMPLAASFVLFLFATAWCEARVRRETFALRGAVRLMIFEHTHRMLPYALLCVFIVSGAAPWVIAKRTIVQFNLPIALFILAVCSLVYFKSFGIARVFLKVLVPINDGVIEQRFQELSSMVGVKAGNLLRLRTYGYPYAQGYALLNGDICLSDCVIDGFPSEERDAVIAHELGHLLHIKKLIAKHFAVYIACVLAFLFLLPLCDVYFSDSLAGFLSKFSLVYGCLLLMISMNKSSRGYELEADRFSASAVGEDVFVRAMERLHEINLLPRRFNEKGRENMLHPSLEIRTNAVMQSKQRTVNDKDLLQPQQ
jgi:Zn-dependent protease with chaperone function